MAEAAQASVVIDFPTVQGSIDNQAIVADAPEQSTDQTWTLATGVAQVRWTIQRIAISLVRFSMRFSFCVDLQNY
jgi:hypothetical protein